MPLAEIAYGKPMSLRTSVGDYASIHGFTADPKELITRTAKQVPAANAGWDLFAVPGAYLQNATNPEKQVTQKNIAEMFQVLPLGTFPLMRLIAEETAHFAKEKDYPSK